METSLLTFPTLFLVHFILTIFPSILSFLLLRGSISLLFCKEDLKSSKVKELLWCNEFPPGIIVSGEYLFILFMLSLTWDKTTNVVLYWLHNPTMIGN